LVSSLPGRIWLLLARKLVHWTNSVFRASLLARLIV
jgi:hypothetical protein